MSRPVFAHPVMAAFLEAAAASRHTVVTTQSLGAGPLEVDYPAAVAEESRSHSDAADDRDDLAPISDETLHEPRDRRSERERLMDEVGMSAKDFF
jgi:hypothetical protein